MRIIILSLGYFPDIGGNAMILTRLSRDIAAAGHDVHVICGFPYHGLSEVMPEYKGKFFVREELEGVHLHRSFNYTSTSKSIVAKILNQFSFVFSSLFAALRAPRGDVLFVLSPPLLLGVTGFLISRLKRMPFIYNVQDIHPQYLIDVGFLKNKNAIRFWEGIERFVYRRADIIMNICETAREFLIREKGVERDKTVVIENFTDTSLVRVLPRENTFREQHGLTEKFIVLSAGTMSMSQDLQSVLDTASLMRANDDIHFLVVGEGTQRKEVAARAAQMKLDNLTMLPFQSEEVMPLMMATADVCLVNTKRAVSIVSLPSKIFGIMAAARPIVATVSDDSAAAELISNAAAGLCVEPENPEEMKNAILYFYNNPRQAKEMGASGREYVEVKNSRDVIAKRYLEFFDSFEKKLK